MTRDALRGNRDIPDASEFRAAKLTIFNHQSPTRHGSCILPDKSLISSPVGYNSPQPHRLQQRNGAC
jgi:hypothetical protein